MDVYVFEGDGVLVRAGVALLVRREMELLGTAGVGEVRGVLEAGVGAGGSGVAGEEEKWMVGVKEAGKA